MRGRQQGTLLEPLDGRSALARRAACACLRARCAANFEWNDASITSPEEIDERTLAAARRVMITARGRFVHRAGVPSHDFSRASACGPANTSLGSVMVQREMERPGLGDKVVYTRDRSSPAGVGELSSIARPSGSLRCLYQNREWPVCLSRCLPPTLTGSGCLPPSASLCLPASRGCPPLLSSIARLHADRIREVKVLGQW